MPTEEHLLTRLSEPLTPEDLGERIFHSILRAKMHRLAQKLILVMAGFFICLAYAAANASAIWAELQTSSFFSMLRLSFSDSDVLFKHSRDLFFALLESFPLISVILALTCACFLIGAGMLTNTLRYTRRDLLTLSLS